jgi:hypothetical protein
MKKILIHGVERDPLLLISTAVGLIVAILIVYSESAEFNDFPAPVLIGLAYASVILLTAYYCYVSQLSQVVPLVFILFFQATAVRARDYEAFVQAHTLSILFLALSISRQNVTKITGVIYGAAFLSSLLIVTAAI